MEDEKPSLASKTLIVTTLSSEWKSLKGGLTTINRELAIQLAKHRNVKVYMYLPKCTEEDKEVARSQSVELIKATELSGYEPIDWLAILPERHLPHILIGHGLHLGRQIQLIKRHHDCKWVQVVHTAPEELGMYKDYEQSIPKGEEKHQAEVNLCKQADHVLAVGPKLADSYSHYLRSSKKHVIDLTPGIFEEFCNVEQADEEGKTFDVLVFGRGDGEDFSLKGYDIAVQAVAELEDSSYRLLFVGALAGEENEVKERLLQHRIQPSQLTVRRLKERRKDLADLFCEVDLAIMPSRTEGFGLTALEALSAGLPVLVSGNSGLGDALKNVVPSDVSHVVYSEDPMVWANAIRAVRKRDRKVRLTEAKLVRERYALKYSWQTQCDRLVETMLRLSFEVGTLEIQQETNASQSVAEGQGIKEGTVGGEAQFVLTTRNGEGEQCYNEHDRVTVEIRDEQGGECATEVRINDSKDGSYKISYSPKDQGKYKVTVKVNGEHVLDSPFSIEVKLFQLRSVLSFGKRGSSFGMLYSPWGVAVNARDEIAVTDSWKHRVQIFNSDGKYLRSFRRGGNKAGEFKYPKGITFHKNGNIFVAEQYNNRIQIFSEEGEHVGMFGGYGSLDSQLIGPWGLSVDSDGNIIVADAGNKLIKIFSPDGKFLMKIGGQGSLTYPIHCVQCDRYLIVSDAHEHCVKVFNYDGNFQYKFGKHGRGDGELSSPGCLSVNNSGHLMVCDSGNNRIQVFQLNGKFVGKFGTQGSNLGEFNSPESLALLSTGRIVVSEWHNHRIQILE